jgi:CheY-like chemotaxis protein
MTLFPRRILIVDDNPALHEDYRKVLCPERKSSARLSDLEKLVLGSQTKDTGNSDISFEVDSAHQGKDGLELVKKALSLGRPYSMAFVDMRMEPGWNGIETIRQLWLVSPDLQIVLCSAYSDYSWSEIVQTLGATDNLVILRKPFDNIEVLQLALALCKKWESAREVQSHLARLGTEVVVRTNQAAVATEMLKEESAARSQPSSGRQR